jgi:alcohol dehydrogenase
MTMRAVLFEDIGSIQVGDYPDPTIVDPGDAIVNVDTAAICGSDLHLLHGRIPGMRPHSPIGHEVVGTITEVGPDVSRFKVGDRVVASFGIACGTCWFCQRKQFNHCDLAWFLGYGMFTGDLDGGQAQFVRVPVADVNLHAVDPALSDEQAVFAGDILTTSVYVCERAGISEGDTVAILGAGPVGLLTLMNVMAYKPGQVFVVDSVPDRLKMAESLGAVPLDMEQVNPVIQIQRATGDRGADVIIEAVGLAPAFTTALNAVRAGGTVAVIGVHSDFSFDFPIGEVWRRGITIIMAATCNVQAFWDRALEQVKAGVVDPTMLITHTLPLEEAVEGYRLFGSHEALKVILKP